MDIVFHTHHAPASERMQRRAEQALRKLGRRVPRSVDAVVRFEQDGPTRRVELVLHTARGRRYVARSESRYFGTALTEALRRLERQLDSVKRVPRTVARKARARKTGRIARA